jgi:hypothetical protein
MNSHYSELKDLPQLRGSLNTIVSVKHNQGMRRPPSLSESYAWDPDNIERLQYEQQKAATIIIPEQLPIQPPPLQITTISNETIIINFSLRLLFHISFISLFESLFFFFYVSTLEDSGILNVVGGFIQSAVHTCSNSTQFERIWINTILSYFINTSQIYSNGEAALVSRSIQNTKLMMRSWYYVGGCSGLCFLMVIYAKFRHIRIFWKNVILENAALVILLAAYEYMFFSTIITPYVPITGDEIAERAVKQLNMSCGLFY